MWECPDCQTSWLEEVELCPLDGQKRVATLPPPTVAPVRPAVVGGRPAPRHRQRRRKVVTTLVVLATVGGGVAAKLASPKQPDKVAAAPAPDTEAAVPSDGLPDCPSQIGVQLDWLPRFEHAAFFVMLGDEVDIDPAEGTVTGVMSGVEGGDEHRLQLRFGLPGIDFESVEAVLDSDNSVMIGMTSSDQQLLHHSEHPTVGVARLLRKSPQAILWNRALAPGAQIVQDLGPLNGSIKVDAGSTFAAWLQGTLDHPVDADLGFGASIGDDDSMLAQSGNATDGPEQLRSRPSDPVDVGVQLLYDAGWKPSAGVLAIKSNRVGSLSNCLRELIPAIQRAQKSAVDGPGKVAGRIEAAAAGLGRFWTYPAETTTSAAAVMKELGIVEIARNGVIGQFDFSELSDFCDVYAFTVSGAVRVEPSSLATNRFIDKSVVAG